MPTLISHDDHDILSERLNRFTNGELSGAHLGYRVRGERMYTALLGGLGEYIEIAKEVV